MGRSVVVRARGHREIRATHGKTLELTGEAEISGRATCVVGVAAELEPGDVGLLRGAVSITLAAGGRSASGTAVINPDHGVRDRLVIRRSEWADADTLAVASTLTADDIDADLAALLADPDTEVTLTLAETEPVPPLVLLTGAGRLGGRLGVLAAAARATVDLGRPGRGAIPLDALVDGATVVARLPEPWQPVTAGARAWFSAAEARGARFAGDDVAWPAPILAAAGLPPVPVIWLGKAGRREVRDPAVADLLGAAPVPVALAVPVADAAATLALVAGAKPDHRIAVGDNTADVGVAVGWLAASEAAAAIASRTAATVPVVVPPRPGETRRVDVAAAVRALAAAGVAPRTLSEALAPLGISRRQIYDATAL